MAKSSKITGTYPSDTYTVRGVIFGTENVVDLSVGIFTNDIVQISRPSRERVTYGDENCMIVPTLVDTQVNGAFGVDLQADDLCVEDVWEIAAYLAASGVSNWFPTLTTAPIEAMASRCAVIAEAAKEMPPPLGAAIAGIHLEGPFISPEDGARGAHPLEHVRPPNVKEMEMLLRAGGGLVRCVTLAPGLPKVKSLIRLLVKQGVVVSLGHHNATAKEITEAVDEGATLCTHLGNGLPAMIHRHNNPLWPQLADPDLGISVIGDLHHLPVEMLEVLVRAKGWEKTLLVSDCTRLAGMPTGEYTMMGQTVEKLRGGKVVLKGTDLLAGSSTPLFEAVQRLCANSFLQPLVLHGMASMTPAGFFGIDYPGWPLEYGKKANFILHRAGGVGYTARDLIQVVMFNGGMHTPSRYWKVSRHFPRGCRKETVERHQFMSKIYSSRQSSH